MIDQDWNYEEPEPRNEDEYYDEQYELEYRMPLSEEEFEDAVKKAGMPGV